MKAKHATVLGWIFLLGSFRFICAAPFKYEVLVLPRATKLFADSQSQELTNTLESPFTAENSEGDRVASIHDETDLIDSIQSWWENPEPDGEGSTDVGQIFGGGMDQLFPDTLTTSMGKTRNERRVGRSLKSIDKNEEENNSAEIRESRVLEEDGDSPSRGRERRQATTSSPLGGFLPPQLQGLGGVMEDSQVVVGSFTAVIMPGSAVNNGAAQVGGLMNNMPSVPSLPGAG